MFSHCFSHVRQGDTDELFCFFSVKPSDKVGRDERG